MIPRARQNNDNSINSEKIQIKIIENEGYRKKNFSISIMPSEKTLYIKEYYCMCRKLLPNEYKLEYEGKELVDSKTLEQVYFFII
jgi:hypothetical protein